VLSPPGTTEMDPFSCAVWWDTREALGMLVGAGAVPRGHAAADAIVPGADAGADPKRPSGLCPCGASGLQG